MAAPWMAQLLGIVMGMGLASSTPAAHIAYSYGSPEYGAHCLSCYCESGLNYSSWMYTFRHSMVYIPNVGLILFGGSDQSVFAGSKVALDGLMLYEFGSELESGQEIQSTTNSLIDTAEPRPSFRYDHTAVALEGSMLIFGGLNYSEENSTFTYMYLERVSMVIL
eukprot:Skav219232  [mRNA]  locus=scaffold2965:223716:224210:- [translate_table: standard]